MGCGALGLVLGVQNVNLHASLGDSCLARGLECVEDVDADLELRA